MTMHVFRNQAKKLRFIDRDEVPFLNEKEWTAFRDDPLGYFMRADDLTANRIWDSMK